MTLTTIQSAIAAIKSAPRSTNGGVLWIADPTLMVKVAAAIIGSGHMHAAMEEITSATGVTEPTLKLFVRGKDAQHRPCKVILDGLKAAGLRPVAYTKRPNRASYSKKYTTISAAWNSSKPIAATDRPQSTLASHLANPKYTAGMSGLHIVGQVSEHVEGWSLKGLRDALAVARALCEEAENVLIQRTSDMVDSCESYAHKFSEVAGQWKDEEKPFSVIVKTSSLCAEVINLSIDTNRAIDDWRRAVKHLRDLLEDYKVLRASRWPFMPEILD